MGVSIREYTRHRDVAESTVCKALRSGCITAKPNGTIEPGTADAAWKPNTNAAKRRKRKAVPKMALEAECGIDSLYAGKRLVREFERTASRLHEMQTESYLSRTHCA